MINFILKSKVTIFIIIAFFVLILLVVALSTSQPSPPKTSPTPTTSLITPLQKTSIGKTNQKEVEKIPGVSREDSINQETIYTYPSISSLRPNIIIVKESQVVFERVRTDPDLPSVPKITQYQQQYGTAEKAVQGSKFYGPYTSTHIYGTKGFALIADTESGDIKEFHLFTPITTEDYIRLYGDDLESGYPESESL